MPTFDRRLLLDMLSYARPMGSATEELFCDRYLAPLPGAYQDRFGNWHVTVGDAPILWSAHTDTVHVVGGRQTLAVQGDLVRLSRRSRRQSACLGADDTAGCALLVQMIGAGIAGRYVFHYGEERGGHGSDDLARHHDAWLRECRCAIAFDRKGTDDVITHQYGRCCSDAFALSVARQLNIGGLAYRPSSHGVFTDTANYVDAIGECSNLSVGYAHAHSEDETLDMGHLARLFDAVCAADWQSLTYARAPGEREVYALPAPSTSPLFARFDDADWLETCIDCQSAYDPQFSRAEDNGLFCSPICEMRWLQRFLDRTRGQAEAQITHDNRDLSKDARKWRM